jgi:hypothetical protein
MKIKIFLLLFVSLSVVFFTSCKNEEVVLTGISVDQASLSVNVGEKATIVATVQPKGAEATITWSTSNSAVATVVNGEVTGVAAGTADIVATAGTFTAKCVVTVTTVGPDFSASLKGTEYYPIILDGVTATALGAKIKADLRPDELTKFLYVWDNTFNPATSVGPNFYGEVEVWTSLTVGTVGWSGAGFNVKDGALLDKLAPITANTDKYYLHIGIRSKTNAVYVFGMDGQSGVKFAIGATAFNDNGTLIQPLADFTRDGEWQEIEIPISTLKTNGLLYSTGMGEKNVLWFLAGGIAGTTIDLDAVFIYKKP